MRICAISPPSHLELETAVTYFKSVAEGMDIVVHGKWDQFRLEMLIALEAWIGRKVSVEVVACWTGFL